ncbi:transaldolase family protein [Propionicicella superfundia]|uniref:transaldolase family protein n=1 Tax=Propionicicella superfundia TaxID=348582 RepID=UPI00040792D5|nr:transaldolase family protein [Propionicicella superfundia]
MPTTPTYTPGPLLTAAKAFPTVLWNDSSDLAELRQSISFGGVGATCNPVIAYTTISKHPDIWNPRIAAIAAEHPEWGESRIGWQAVKDMSVEAAALLEPIFVEHEGRNGRLSVQTDPRLHRDAAALADQAEEFSRMAPNIIVKIPATRIGIEAIEEATYRGVSINVTVSFSVAQAVVAGEAIERGLRRRDAEGLDTATMGPVVTIMVGRLDDWLKHVVARDKIFIDSSALEWAGVATFKEAYRIFRERGLRSRLLTAAFRNVMQWSEFQGGDVVISPPFGWQQIINASGYEPTARMDVPVDEHYLSELRRIPDFNRAYELDGLTIDEFETFGPTVRTLRQFLAADADLDALVRDVLVPAV